MRSGSKFEVGVKKEVSLYTDGSCLGNPGPGGYGAILKYKEHVKELSRGYRLTTNNRMELLAVIAGLEALNQSCKVQITCDSMYVKNGISEWIFNWKRKGWKTASGKDVKNVDLWQKLDALCAQHEISWKWVRGHNGHLENERCDELARTAAKGSDLRDDDTQA